MADIVLQNGKTLVYNRVDAISVENGMVALRKGGYLIARIPVDIIERAEFNKPCKIIYPRPKKKK